MNNWKKIALIIILFSGVILSQYFFDQNKRKRIKLSPVLPKFEIVEASDLGLDNAFADYYYLSAIQYFGDWRSDNYEKLDDYIKLVNDLNPKFSHPYAFATLILPELGQTDNAIEIAKTGIEKAEPDWQIPYYLAIAYFLNKKDPAEAMRYFDLAARTEGAPENIQKVATNFRTRPDLRQQSKEIWISLYENSNDEVIEERAKKYITHYEILDLLENSAEKYKEKTGSYPSDPELLIKEKILKAIPPDPFGYQFEIGNNGRARIKE